MTSGQEEGHTIHPRNTDLVRVARCAGFGRFSKAKTRPRLARQGAHPQSSLRLSATIDEST